MLNVRLALPNSGSQIHILSALGGLWHPTHRNDVRITPGIAGSSLLPFTFNILWSSALNDAKQGHITHFAMLHADICPDAGWLDVLLVELEENDADIVAAVVPIKDGRGLTSTALDTTGNPWNPYRLTMKDVFERTETFTHPQILLNSGCWACDLRKPWCRKVWFQQMDIIRTADDGTMVPETASEDWNFSRAVRAAGGDRLFATRKVGLCHDRPEFHNKAIWGEWSRDHSHDPKPAPPVSENPWDRFGKEVA